MTIDVSNDNRTFDSCSLHWLFCIPKKSLQIIFDRHISVKIALLPSMFIVRTILKKPGSDSVKVWRPYTTYETLLRSHREEESSLSRKAINGKWFRRPDVLLFFFLPRCPINSEICNESNWWRLSCKNLLTSFCGTAVRSTKSFSSCRRLELEEFVEKYLEFPLNKSLKFIMASACAGDRGHN